jgi:hypothetical protein
MGGGCRDFMWRGEGGAELPGFGKSKAWLGLATARILEGLRLEWLHDAAANMKADALARLYINEEDGVVALVASGLRVRVDGPGLLDRIGDDELNFAVGDVKELEGLLDNVDVPSKELGGVDALFAMLARVMAIDITDGAIAVRLLFLAWEWMERIGKDAAVLIDVDAQRSVESIGAVVGLAGLVCGLLGDGSHCETEMK